MDAKQKMINAKEARIRSEARIKELDNELINTYIEREINQAIESGFTSTTIEVDDIDNLRTGLDLLNKEGYTVRKSYMINQLIIQLKMVIQKRK